ncbi:serine hydrolase domain-containing protein [Georgenia alba]|uniref:Serine hydrolase domain-containing protein n=1 Tax=Georgenia alba TaxID=2233858 RepID=A0ABW2Q855_9MICO
MSTSSATTVADAELREAVAALLAEATRTALARVPQVAPTRAGTPGAQALVAHRGRVVAHAWDGHAVLHDPDGGLLPVAQREPVTARTRWDIASLTKLLTATTALVQHDAGTIDLDAPVVEHLPAFAGDGEPERRAVTVRHLLTHTAGLPPVTALWEVPPARRAGRVLTEPITARPGRRHVYSCVGHLVLGLLLTEVTGRDLPSLVGATVTGPLGMASTSWTPAPGAPVAATEYQDQPPRGLVRGEVHDETAWALGGAGNAGAFSTAEDLLRLAEEVRTGAGGLLRPESRALLRTGTLPAEEARRVGFDQAVGLRVGGRGPAVTGGPELLWHAGFTGTLLAVDLDRDTVVVLLTNRVHPRRRAFDVDPLRRALVTAAQGWAQGRTNSARTRATSIRE